MHEFSEAQTMPFDITIASRQELDSVAGKGDRPAFHDRNAPTRAKLLSYPRFLLAATSSGLVYFLCCYPEPILALRLKDFNLNAIEIGIFFAIWAIFYIPSSIAVQFLPRKISKRVTIITSSALCGLGFLLFGPSRVLGMPDSLVVLGIGQAFIGTFTAVMIIPGLPEMVEFAQNTFGQKYEREINDLSAGIFNAFLGFGQGLAPLFGSLSMSKLGWRYTSDIVAFTCIVFALIYYAFGGGSKAFSKTLANFREKESDFKEPLLPVPQDSL